MNAEMQTITNRVEQLERDNAVLRAQFGRERRRFRVQAALALAVVVGATLVSPSNRAALAQGANTIVQRVAALEAKTQYVSVSGGQMYITGTNLHIVNGSGSTSTVDGLGNLIVGYNEMKGYDDVRTGSHNIVTGGYQNYSSYGGLVAGVLNTISAPYASVSGGNNNTASFHSSSVSGGYGNTASGSYSSVSGGQFNVASGYACSLSGGSTNTASGQVCSVSGGAGNTAGGDNYASSVSGGAGNIASGNYASISGGVNNTASGLSSISGGFSITQGNVYGWSGGSQGGITTTGNFRSP